MRIWLHSSIEQMPTIMTTDDGGPLVVGGIFRYKRWQTFLSHRMPRIFPTFGLYVPLDGGPERICGWTIVELEKRIADAS